MPGPKPSTERASLHMEIRLPAGVWWVEQGSGRVCIRELGKPRAVCTRLLPSNARPLRRNEGVPFALACSDCLYETLEQQGAILRALPPERAGPRQEDVVRGHKVQRRRSSIAAGPIELDRPMVDLSIGSGGGGV